GLCDKPWRIHGYDGHRTGNDRRSSATHGFAFDLFTMEADFNPDRTKQVRGLRLLLEQPSRGRIFVLRHNGTILGMINLLFTISTAEGGFVILLEDVVVHKDHRHQ